MDDHTHRGPGHTYLVLLVIAALVAWMFVRPLGLQIRDVFQTLVDAFNHQ